MSAALLHLPIGIAYLSALRRQGAISRGDWTKTAMVLALSFGVGVAFPNVHGADRNTPYKFTAYQMGRYRSDPMCTAPQPIPGSND